MTIKRYSWKNGPDIIQQHSVAKHTVLKKYLAAYFKTLVSNPRQENFRVTLVDGFAGGGLYTHANTRELVLGSPFICLDAVEEASIAVNIGRIKPVKLDVHYVFIEADRDAHQHLSKLLYERGFGSRLGNDIQLRHATFQSEMQTIVDDIHTRSPKNGRSIFVLDQYGYKDVPGPLIQQIFNKLPRAEVILTFGVDSLLNFASDSKSSRKLLDEIGLSGLLGGRSIEEIKESERDWRLFVQSGLYRGLVDRCGAQHYTPFFIRNNEGHGDYWLVHMSNHPRARDVMTEVHWQNQNQFVHFGGAGLRMFQMLGYDPDQDPLFRKQFELGFQFDNVARRASVDALKEQLPRLIYARDEGVRFGELFGITCNETPATEAIYRQSLQDLVAENIIEIFSDDGSRRRSANQIKVDDWIRAPQQRDMFFVLR